MQNEFCTKSVQDANGAFSNCSLIINHPGDCVAIRNPEKPPASRCGQPFKKAIGAEPRTADQAMRVTHINAICVRPKGHDGFCRDKEALFKPKKRAQLQEDQNLKPQCTAQDPLDNARCLLEYGHDGEHQKADHIHVSEAAFYENTSDLPPIICDRRIPYTAEHCKLRFGHEEKCTNEPYGKSLSQVEVRYDSDQAIRYDQGKLRYDLLPPKALEDLVKVYTFGCTKYSPRNWEKGGSWCAWFAAIGRHIFAWLGGENIDKETGCHHMTCAAWGALCLVEWSFTGVGEDDRPYRSK